MWDMDVSIPMYVRCVAAVKLKLTTVKWKLTGNTGQLCVGVLGWAASKETPHTPFHPSRSLRAAVHGWRGSRPVTWWELGPRTEPIWLTLACASYDATLTNPEQTAERRAAGFTDTNDAALWICTLNQKWVVQVKTPGLRYGLLS